MHSLSMSSPCDNQRAHHADCDALDFGCSPLKLPPPSHDYGSLHDSDIVFQDSLNRASSLTLCRGWFVSDAYLVLFKNATRPALGATAFISLSLFLGDHRQTTPWAPWVMSAGYYGAVTCVVVNNHMVGDIGSKSFERALGTVIGGAIAWVITVNLLDCHVLMVAILFVWIWGCNSFNEIINMVYSGKVASFTFCVVSYELNARVTEVGEDIVLSRVAGILVGSLLSGLLSLCVFPSAASDHCIDQLAAMFVNLHKLHEVSR